MTDSIISNTVLKEVADQIGKAFDIIKFVGTDDSTEFLANDENKVFFLKGEFKTPVPELKGEFGIPDVSLFNGLLRFPSYNADGAKISVTRETKTFNNKEIEETVTEFKFRDKSNKGANYRTMSAQHKIMEDLATDIPEIPWDVSFKPEKSKISEFFELARLCSGFSENIAISLINKELIFSFGDENDSSHNANMTFATDVEGILKKISYPTSLILNVLKIVANSTFELKLSNRRIFGVFTESENVNYKYYVRGSV
jgi:hypothetical protein